MLAYKVGFGEILLDLHILDSWDSELERMNVTVSN
jgi:hypothetical protein